MKKIIVGAILGCSLLSTQALATENSMYVGLDMLKSNNTFTFDDGFSSVDTDVDSKGFKFKIGSASSNGWRMQGYYLREVYDETLFDYSNDVLNEVGFDIIKAFEITPKFSPFIQAGLGYGWMDVEGYNESSIKEVSFNNNFEKSHWSLADGMNRKA